MVDFASILNKPAESIKKPPPMPVGTYLCMVNGPHKQKEVNDKPIIEIPMKTIQAQPDVTDLEALALCGGMGKIISNDFWMVDNDGNASDWALLKFLEHTLGIEKTGKSLSQMLSESPGKQCLVNVQHRIYTDKNNEPAIAVRIGGTAKA